MKALVFDTETTGLTKNRTIKLDMQPEVIEIYAVLMDLKKNKKLKELRPFRKLTKTERGLEYLIKPKKPLLDKPLPGDKKTITQITGITNDALKDAPQFEEVADAIFAMMEEAPIIIAHNASFDRDMINIEAERMNKTLVWPKVLCTVEQTIHVRGYRLSLSNLHEELFKEPFAGAHRAKIDVEALTRCCVELVKRKIL
jgi:DNA polymerase-3 subunit alpha